METIPCQHLVKTAIRRTVLRTADNDRFGWQHISVVRFRTRYRQVLFLRKTKIRGISELGYFHERFWVRSGGVVIVKNVVVIIGAMTDDVDIISNGCYIYLYIRIIIEISVGVIFSIVVRVAVDFVVCVVTVACIYVGVTVNSATAIQDVFSSVGASAFVGPVTDDIVGLGIAGAMIGGSRQTMDMIDTVRISGGNYFDDSCLQGVSVLVYCVD